MKHVTCLKMDMYVLRLFLVFFVKNSDFPKMMLSKSQHALAAVCARQKSAEHAPGL